MGTMDKKKKNAVLAENALMLCLRICSDISRKSL